MSDGQALSAHAVYAQQTAALPLSPSISEETS